MTAPTHAKEPPAKSERAVRQKSGSVVDQELPASPLWSLVGVVGNRGMERLLRVQRKCSCGGTCAQCQINEELERIGARAKLMVSQPNDPLEQQADQMAEEVMRSEDPAGADGAAGEGRPQQRGAGGGGSPSSIGDMSGRGQQLPSDVRRYFEPRFGRDLGRVHIHTDGAAASAARSIGARAFAVGNTIAFGEGQFSPHTGDGRRLIAHELAHVVQHESGSSPRGTAFRQVPAPGGPGGPCNFILSEIGRLLDELKSRIVQALLDEHGLYQNHRSTSNAHPQYGSWDGHRQKWESVREELKTQRVRWLTEPCDDDDFPGAPELVRESQEYVENVKYPSRPDPSRAPQTPRVVEPEETGIPSWVWWAVGAAVTAAIIACFAAGVCEAGAILAGVGAAARAAIMWGLRFAGVTIIASRSGSGDEGTQAGAGQQSTDDSGESSVA